MNESVDECGCRFVTCSSILVSETQDGSCRDVYIAESDGREVEALASDLLGIFLLCRSDVIFVDAPHYWGDLGVNPLLCGLDAVPEDHVPREYLLQQKGWANVLELVESLWHLEL